jgi:hypothetical protein
VQRIAHGYGNRRDRLERALAAGVDFVEADARWDGREVWIRHERRLGPLPLLYNNRLAPAHRIGPLGFSAGQLWFRLDVRRMTLHELIDRTQGRAGLMLDLKAARYSPLQRYRFMRRLFETLDHANFEQPLTFCGQWPLLDAIRDMRPSQPVYYSVDRPFRWVEMGARIRGGDAIPGITLRRELFTAERVAFLRERGVDVFAWDIDTADQAADVIAFGAAGVIADDLDLLAELADTPVAGAVA